MNDGHLVFRTPGFGVESGRPAQMKTSDFSPQALHDRKPSSQNNHFFSRSAITFSRLLEGERVLKFGGLLPTLRVTRVSDETQGLTFIQENRKEDGSFYAILDEALPVGKGPHHYDRVRRRQGYIRRGGGSYYVGARPRSGGIRTSMVLAKRHLRSHFQKSRKNNVGHQRWQAAKPVTEEVLPVSHWVTPSPVTVGRASITANIRRWIPDDHHTLSLSGYYLTELPSSLQDFAMVRSVPWLPCNDQIRVGPRRALKCSFAPSISASSLRNRSHHRGSPNLISDSPWPSLVYLPISSLYHSTQRWMLFGHIDNNFTVSCRKVLRTK